MTIFRRFLVLLVLFFWQGGFLFYSAVVIHISRTELGPRSKATVITTNVTYYLNLAGMASMVPLLWDVFAPDVSRRRRWLRGGLWAMLLLTLAVQLFLYGELKHMVAPILAGEDPPTFQLAHKAFLWATTVQMAATIGYLIASLLAWRAADRAEGKAA